jgi:hypothetical protein
MATLARADFRNDSDLDIGKKDSFSENTYFKVFRVLGPSEVLVNNHNGQTQNVGKFILRIPTKGLVDGRDIPAKGLFEVVDTKTVDKKTYFLLVPAK